MGTLRYIDFGDNYVLLEKPIVAEKNSEKVKKIRTINFKDGFSFEKIFTIFVLNKDCTWLCFSPSQVEKIPIYNIDTDKVYIFAKVPIEFSLSGYHSLCIYDLEPSRAIFVTLHSLLQQDEHEICQRLVSMTGNTVVSDLVKTAFTPNEKLDLLDYLAHLVVESDLGFLAPKAKKEDTSVLDLFAELMRDENLRFYPFQSCSENKHYPFIPDSSFSVLFHQCSWHKTEISLSAVVCVPGSVYLREPKYHLPEKISTCCVMTIDLVKNGVVCFEKLVISGSDKKMSYIDLSQYALLTKSDFDITQDLEAICNIVHNKNLAYLRFMCLSYLKHKLKPKRFKETPIQKHDKMMKLLSNEQKEYLEKNQIFETLGFCLRPSSREHSFSFNIYEDEMDFFLERVTIVLKSYVASKRLTKTFKKHFDQKLLETVDELITDVFNEIYENGLDYFSRLNQLLSIALRDTLENEILLQKIRCLLTYTHWGSEIKEAEMFSVEYGSFTFVFELRDESYLGYCHAHKG